MNRRMLGFAFCFLVLTAPFAGARPTERVVSATYEPVQGAYGIQQPGLLVSSVVLPGGSENYVSVEISDRSGRPVLGKIVQQDEVAVFCGRTEEPVRVDPGFDVTVQLHAADCHGQGPSTITGGIIEASFKRMAFRATESKAYGAAGNSNVIGIDDPMPIVRAADVYFIPAGRPLVKIRVEDASGSVAGAKILQDGRRSELFCGETAKPMRVNPKQPFQVLLFSGNCDGAASVVTHGSVTATFLRPK